LTVKEAISECTKHGFDQFPVKMSDGSTGMLTTSIMTTKLVKNKISLDDAVEKIALKDMRNASSHITLNELARILNRHIYVLVEGKYVVSNFDLLKFFALKNGQ